MIAHPLPMPGSRPDRLHTGIFSDHTLLTGTVEDAYDYPGHTAGVAHALYTLSTGALIPMRNLNSVHPLHV